MRKQLELDFSCIKDLRDDVKNQIKEHTQKRNNTKRTGKKRTFKKCKEMKDT